MDVQLLTLLFF